MGGSKDPPEGALDHLLRVLYHISHEDAVQALQKRLNVAGEPLMPRPALLVECQEWLETLGFH